MLPCRIVLLVLTLIGLTAAIGAAAPATAENCKKIGNVKWCLGRCADVYCISDCQRPDMKDDCQYAWFADGQNFVCAVKSDYPAACQRPTAANANNRPISR